MIKSKLLASDFAILVSKLSTCQIIKMQKVLVLAVCFALTNGNLLQIEGNGKDKDKT